MLVLTGAEGDVTHLAFGPGGRHLAASGGGRGLELWDLPSGDKWGRYERGMHLSDGPPAFHPARPRCYARASGGVAEIETDSKKARTLVTPLRTWYAAWDLGPDGEWFVGHLNGLGGITRFRRGADDTLRADWSVPPERHSPRSREPLTPLAFRSGPDGTWFVSVGGERNRYGAFLPSRVTVRATADGALLQTARVPPTTLPWPAVDPAGRRFATVRAGRLSVWDADDLTAEPRELRNDGRRHFTAAAFHPSGRFVAATSNDATVKLYDTATWRLARTFTWDVGRMRSVAFSPDGSLAAAGTDTGKVVVWDVDL